jgi:fimbrial chaperone protein
MAVYKILLAATLAIATVGGAAANTLTVFPLRIHLPPDAKPEVVRLHNGASSSVLVQVQAVAWRDQSQIDDAPVTNEVLAVPPVFDLPPGSEQLIRLALRAPLTEHDERAYRLLITQVPQEVIEEPNTVAFAMRFNLPVFATPPGAEAAPVWRVRAGAGGAAELVLLNGGRAHYRLGKFALAGGGPMAPLLESEQAGYVLAGESRVWPLGRPLAELPPALEVRLEREGGPEVVAVARD